MAGKWGDPEYRKAYFAQYNAARREKMRTYRKSYRIEHLDELRAKDRVYAADHREEARTRANEWYYSHPEQAKASRKAWASANAEKVILDYQAWRNTHLDEIHAYDRQRNKTEERRRRFRDYARHHAEENRARVKAWAGANPDRVREQGFAAAHRRRAKLAKVEHEKIDRRAIFERDRWVCGICGKKVKPSDASIDHILPISQGGAHIESNVQCAHLACNRFKRDGRVPSQLRLRLSV